VIKTREKALNRDPKSEALESRATDESSSRESGLTQAWFIKFRVESSQAREIFRFEKFRLEFSRKKI
jgi:hypothetical protein